jgi:hypothetical protein
MNVEELARENGALTVNSPRAGGKYKISGASGSMAGVLPLRDKAIITSWLVEQRRNGIEIPEIEPNGLEELRRRRPMLFSERAARVLRYCEAKISKIGEGVGADLGDGGDEVAYELMALTESQDAEELSQLLLLLVDTGLIKDEAGMGGFEIAPTPSGWLRIEEMQVSATDTSQAFVAM